MIAGVIFDLDGTLTDSMPIWETVGADYLRAEGTVPPDDLAERLIPLSMPQTIDYFRTELGVAASPAQIYEGIMQRVEGFYLTEAPLKPGVAALLSALAEAGIPCAVATAQERHLTERCLARLGVLSSFSGICVCSELGRGKQFPDVYEAACTLLGSAPAETLVFEDALYAAATAKAAGFLVAGVYDRSADADRAALTALADYYFESLEECEELFA